MCFHNEMERNKIYSELSVINFLSSTRNIVILFSQAAPSYN